MFWSLQYCDSVKEYRIKHNIEKQTNKQKTQEVNSKGSDIVKGHLEAV